MDKYLAIDNWTGSFQAASLHEPFRRAGHEFVSWVHVHDGRVCRHKALDFIPRQHPCTYRMTPASTSLMKSGLHCMHRTIINAASCLMPFLVGIFTQMITTIPLSHSRLEQGTSVHHRYPFSKEVLVALEAPKLLTGSTMQYSPAVMKAAQGSAAGKEHHIYIYRMAEGQIFHAHALDCMPCT